MRAKHQGGQAPDYSFCGQPFQLGMQHRQKSAVSLATCWLPKYWLGQGVKSEETIRTSLSQRGAKVSSDLQGCKNYENVRPRRGSGSPLSQNCARLDHIAPFESSHATYPIKEKAACNLSCQQSHLIVLHDSDTCDWLVHTPQIPQNLKYVQ